MTDEKPETPTERLNRVERELKRLERKMDKGFDGFRKDLGACAAERFWAPSDTIGSGNE